MSSDFKQTKIDASLDNLQDIITPEPIGLFPLAEGWYILFFILLAALFYFFMIWYSQYKRDLYRREALKELSRSSSTMELLTLAKRVAISAYGRDAVAMLNGDVWWDFMQNNSELNIDKTLRDELEKVMFIEGYELKDSRHFFSMIELWIATHRRSKVV